MEIRYTNGTKQMDLSHLCDNIRKKNEQSTATKNCSQTQGKDQLK